MVGEGSICTSAAASSRADVGRAADAIFGKREKLGRAESLFRRRKNRGERRREATRQEIGITKAFFENIPLMRPIWGETRFRGWCDSIDVAGGWYRCASDGAIEWLVIWDFTCVEIETIGGIGIGRKILFV